jgi:hypothetical protein
MQRINNANGASSPTLIEPDEAQLRLLDALENAVRQAEAAGWNEDEIYAAIRRGRGRGGK